MFRKRAEENPKTFREKSDRIMRFQRRKIGLDDFELLTIIGRGKIFMACLSFFFSCIAFVGTTISFFYNSQVRLCIEKTTGHAYAMKKQKKSEMLRKNQVIVRGLMRLLYTVF